MPKSMRSKIAFCRAAAGDRHTRSLLQETRVVTVAKRRAASGRSLSAAAACRRSADRSGDAAALSRRERSHRSCPGINQCTARSACVCLRSKPHDRPGGADRNHPPAGGMGGHSRSSDRDRRHLWDEFRPHARAGMVVWLLFCARAHRRHVHRALSAISRLRLALKSNVSAREWDPGQSEIEALVTVIDARPWGLQSGCRACDTTEKSRRLAPRLHGAGAQ